VRAATKHSGIRRKILPLFVIEMILADSQRVGGVACAAPSIRLGVLWTKPPYTRDEKSMKNQR